MYPSAHHNAVSSRGNQRHSEAIRGHQRPSEAIRGHQSSSEAIRGHQSSRGAHRTRPSCTRRLGACAPRRARVSGRRRRYLRRMVIRGHQRSSEVISVSGRRRRYLPSGVIRRNRRPSEVIRSHQKSSEVIRTHKKTLPSIWILITRRCCSLVSEHKFITTKVFEYVSSRT